MADEEQAQTQENQNQDEINDFLEKWPILKEYKQKIESMEAFQQNTETFQQNVATQMQHLANALQEVAQKQDQLTEFINNNLTGTSQGGQVSQEGQSPSPNPGVTPNPQGQDQGQGKTDWGQMLQNIRDLAAMAMRREEMQGGGGGNQQQESALSQQLRPFMEIFKLSNDMKSVWLKELVETTRALRNLDNAPATRRRSRKPAEEEYFEE